MKLSYLLIVLSLLFPAHIFAHDLPDLGDVSQATITPRQEREIGLQIMREIRGDPSYLDDPEVASYLNHLGYKLISNSSESSPGQSFEFFALQDPSINAFALPGGFMGFNSGLIIAAQNESELAGVMAHEIAHVTQKHLARMIAGQKYSLLTSLASLAIAILASRANPQAGGAILAASQAGAVQKQLDFTRKHEEEADRVGLNILLDAGFDPQGMSSFFKRLQEAGRFRDDSAPSYLRTHPITYERIADIQNRTQKMTYRQVQDSMGFLLIRAKLRALQGKPEDAVKQFKTRLQEQRYASEVIERYGFVYALLRDKKYKQAEKELALLYRTLHTDATFATLRNHQLGKTIRVEHRNIQSEAMFETLAAKVKLAANETTQALNIYRAALNIYPQHRALIYDYTTALLQNQKVDAALKFINQQLQILRNDVRLYKLQAQSYAALGDDMLKHRAQAEVYIQQGLYTAAVDQLKIALKNDNGDFYQLSSVEARLKQVKIMAQELEDQE